jgi:serine/threonine protein phosphatase PrpC
MIAPTLIAPLRLKSVSRTHAGVRRALNEDRVLDRPETGLWAVADGMGGHQRGDLAATRIIAALAELDSSGSGYSRLADAERALHAVNAALFSENRGQATSGATLVMFLAHADHSACLWAGDSRAYLWRSRTLTPISRDHSLVQALVDAGELSESERRTHPNAHIVTRAVGAGETLELDRSFAPINAGDIFLLCSDGLTACLNDSELEALLGGGDLDTNADTLLELALSRGASDNVSFVLIQAEARR